MSRIKGLQKLTLLDFPDKTACTVFYALCNLRCPFCHNKDLVFDTVVHNNIEQELYDLLEKRKNILDGVCITGGEPLLDDSCIELIKYIKSKGFLVKLDTNGFFPDRLQYLIDNKLVDYVAVDIKNCPSHYQQTTGIKDIDLSPLERTIKLLLSDTVDYEFRTTVVNPLHNAERLIELAKWIKGAKHYYLQQFINSGNLINANNLSQYDEKTMHEFLKAVQQYIPDAQLRGID